MDYVCGQKEKGKEGTEHLQYCLYFEKKQTPSVITKWLNKFSEQSSHTEPVYADNGVFKYCQKEDTRIDGPWYYGNPPKLRAAQKSQMPKYTM